MHNKKQVVLIIVPIILTLIGAELILRIVSHVDMDGNISIIDRRIRPFQFPIHSLEEKLKHYISQQSSYTQYDSDLGWAVRPNSQSTNGLYFSNSAGVRTSSSHPETLPHPSPGTLRIAIFGDSFTHGDDVPYEESWGHVIETNLKEKGQKTEVINLGGQGYAIDQAFLRWRKHGKPLHPHIVIFGFQNSNVKRTMNLIRMLYSPDTGVIFSKPRFILENETLRLINVPTAKPEDLLSIFKDFESWEFKDHEFFYQEANYEDHPIYTSRLASFIITGISVKFSTRRKGYDFFARESISRKVVWRIIQEFNKEIEEEGGRFMIVHLPSSKPIKQIKEGEILDYQDLLEELKSNYTLIDPSPGLVRQAETSSLDDLISNRSSHYSKLGNQIVGETIAQALLSDDLLGMQ